jgi:tetratricopeptide (TPR) repeat protein
MSTAAAEGCLADEDVASLLEGRLAADHLAAAHDHAGSCDACRELLALAARMRADERAALGVEPTAPSDGETSVGLGWPQTEPEQPLGATIGRFRVLHRLGEGGMGIVLAALDEQLHRKVAIKLLRGTGVGDSQTGHARLLREARAMARVDHPHVVAIHEVGVHDDHVFIVMDLVDGADLHGWLHARPRRWQEIVEVWIGAGEGLAAVHAHGLVHRDFKPHNVLVHEDGRVQVTDFGLVGETAELDQRVDVDGLRVVLGNERTVAGSVLGTPRYMAPEQLEGRAVTAAADQFAFCVSLWEALTGHHPFGDDRDERPHAQLRAAIVEPPRDATAAPARVLSVLRRGLALAPAARHRSMTELLRELRRARELPARRRRAAGLAGVVGLAVIIGSLLGSGPPASTICTEPEGGDFAGQWDDARRERVLAGYRARDGSELADRLAHHLDDHAARWSELRKDACEATRVRGEVSEGMLDRRMACLAARRAAFSTTVDLLEEGTLGDPLTLVLGLPALAPCQDLQGLSADVARPHDEPTAARVLELEAELAAADVLWSAGRSTDARSKLDRILPEAERIGWAPLHTRALLELARLQRDDDPPAALRTWRRAFVVATAAGAAAGFEAALEGVDVHVRVDDLDQAELFVDVATAQAGVLGGEPYPGDLANNRALLATRRADMPAAEQHLRAAIVAVEGDPERRAALVMYCMNLVAVLATQGSMDEARAFSERALAIATELFGDAHPSTLRVEINAANLDFAAGAAALALRTAEHVVTRWSELELPADEAVALDLQARALGALGRPAECLGPAERALVLRRAALAPSDPLIPRSLAILARCLVDAGRIDAALRSLDEASALSSAASTELAAELEIIRAAAQARLGERR